MKGTPEEFRRRYSELTDDALLAIHCDDLVDRARQCLEEELASRGLKPGQPQPAAADNPPEPPQEAEVIAEPEEPEASAGYVCVGSFLFADDAKVAQSVLDSADIPNFQPDQHTLDINWNWTNVLGGRRVMVPADFAEQARDVLAPMLAESNRLFIQRWFDQVWNHGRDSLAKEFGAGADPMLRASVQDLQVRTEEMVADKDKVAVRLTISGMHGGQPVEFQGVMIIRIEGGRIVDTWAMNDAPPGIVS